MALRVHLLSPQIPSQTLKSQTHRPFPSTTLQTHTPKIQISCANSISDAELASDLATELEKMSTHLVQREEAMKKSRQILFTELCQYMGSNSEEVKKTWKKMSDEDKWVLAKGFVSDWGVNFHPLSARSVKDMVEEHLVEDNPSLGSSLFFPNFKKMMGFSQSK
ncbi:uncharacterized protein LOC132301388 [Cornus florida]|uniref:uncharacterized protein LOC132301388 n=1 Tax=Cornus florida TaxID=4283 RepID=UPI0028971982|nr:uncharacterized protein LOC132301388 [Cornus florida]